MCCIQILSKLLAEVNIDVSEGALAMDELLEVGIDEDIFVSLLFSDVPEIVQGVHHLLVLISESELLIDDC